MSADSTVEAMLAGGDRRSIGRSGEVVDFIRRHPPKVVQLLECLWNADPCIRMRAADAAEKISREQAALFQPDKASLLGLLAETTQPEVRWHLASIIPRLQLTVHECRQVAEILQVYLEDRSSIVKTFAMQGLADLTRQDMSLRPIVLEILRSLARTGTPAMRARGRILLRELEAQDHQGMTIHQSNG